jgi:hypothetical protein
LGGNAIFILDRSEPKFFREEAIIGKTVIQLVVVVAGVAVLVSGEKIFPPVELKEGLDRIANSRFHQHCAKAAVVLAVISEQRGPWRHESDEIGIVGTLQEIRPRLFDIAHVAIFLDLDA